MLYGLYNAKLTDRSLHCSAHGAQQAARSSLDVKIRVGVNVRADPESDLLAVTRVMKVGK